MKLFNILSVFTLLLLFNISSCLSHNKCFFDCDCEPSKDLVCGMKKSNNKLRGFYNLCTFTCFNECTGHSYKFIGEGRCGKHLEILYPLVKHED